MEVDDSEPMGYYRVLRAVREAIPEDAIIASEGASTMDIGRTVLPNIVPRARLDAGTFGTMGVGVAQAIAAAAVHPDRKVVAVEGDAGFGFSAMEVEVAVRYNLPITFIVVNNNGIGGGPSEYDPDNIPPGSYMPNARYEKIIEAFGGKGYFVTTVDELDSTLRTAVNDPTPSIVEHHDRPEGAAKTAAVRVAHALARARPHGAQPYEGRQRQQAGGLRRVRKLRRVGYYVRAGARLR